MIDTLQTVSSFLTPATLFILLNLVIATIVLSSRHHQRSSHPPDSPFSSGAYHHHFPLLRTTSPVLERLRSFTLHRFRSGEIPSPTDVHACSSPTRMSNPNPTAVPAESEPNLMAVNGSGDQVVAAAVSAPSPPPPLARTSSILDKLKSINLYRFRSGEIQTEEVIKTEIATSTVSAGTITEQHYGRSQSESISRLAAKKKTVKKTASAGGGGGGDEEVMVRQRRSFRGRDVAVEEEVDARADDFINRFKEQLKIQRLNSILNYKEMLNRGSS